AAVARVGGRSAGLARAVGGGPYLRRAGLGDPGAHPAVARVLVSDRLSEDDLEELVDYVESIRSREHKLRLRVAPAEAIHDRHVIDGDRVLQIGGTATTAGGGTTVLSEPVDLGGAARGYYRQVWKQARKLATYRPSKAPSKGPSSKRAA